VTQEKRGWGRGGGEEAVSGQWDLMGVKIGRGEGKNGRGVEGGVGGKGMDNEKKGDRGVVSGSEGRGGETGGNDGWRGGIWRITEGDRRGK